MRAEWYVRSYERDAAMTERILTPAEAAVTLWGKPYNSSKKQRIYRWIERGVLGDVLRVGRKIYIPRKRLEALSERIDRLPLGRPVA